MTSRCHESQPRFRRWASGGAVRVRAVLYLHLLTAVLAPCASVVASAKHHQPPRPPAAHARYDGRLVVLNHYHVDRVHTGHEYVLVTAAEELLSLSASSQAFEGFKTNDVVRVWVRPAGASSTDLRSGGGWQERVGEQNSGAGDTSETSSEVSSARYHVERVQALPKSWLIPGDSVSVWGDSTTWEDNDPILNHDDSGDTGAHTGHAGAAAAPPSPHRPHSPPSHEQELATIIAQGLKASSSLAAAGAAAAQGRHVVATRTLKVVSDMSMIFYVMDLCGLGGGPATTAERISSTLINNTLAAYVSACSRDIGHVSLGNSVAIDVKLPCSGTLASGDTWVPDSCAGDNLMRLAYAADEYAQRVAGINPRKFRHHVLVLPPGASKWMGETCTWAGTAVLGFAGPAWTYMWVAGEVWDSPQLYMHELGHNYMLGHSSRLKGPATCPNPLMEAEDNIVSHGDMTSAMGYCCQMRCFHAPHSWQMGWSQAMYSLDQVQLTPGTTLKLFIPPQLSARRSFVTVTTNWVSPPPPMPPTPAQPPRVLPPLPPTVTPDRVSAAAQQQEESSLIDYSAYQLERSSEITHVNVNYTDSMQRDESNPGGDTPDTSAVQEQVFASPHTFWISWRPRVSPYDLLMPEYTNMLLIHLYDGVTQSDSLTTFVQAKLHPSNSNVTAWHDVAYGSGLVVRLLDTGDQGGSTGSDGVWVSVCRQSHEAETAEAGLCHDGLDNDCNGLLDNQELACQHSNPGGQVAATFLHLLGRFTQSTTASTQLVGRPPARRQAREAQAHGAEGLAEHKESVVHKRWRRVQRLQERRSWT